MEKLVLNNCGRKLELEYPCSWLYKVIGKDQDLLRQAISEVFGTREILITLSNSSTKGKYHCLNVEVVVHDEADRTANYEALKGHSAVTMIL